MENPGRLCHHTRSVPTVPSSEQVRPSFKQSRDSRRREMCNNYVISLIPSSLCVFSNMIMQRVLQSGFPFIPRRSWHFDRLDQRKASSRQLKCLHEPSKTMTRFKAGEADIQPVCVCVCGGVSTGGPPTLLAHPSTCLSLFISSEGSSQTHHTLTMGALCRH